jgi:sortase A
MPLASSRARPTPLDMHCRVGRRWPARRLAASALLTLGAWQAAEAAWIPVKARLAQRLLARAWRLARSGNEDARPWPWADTRPLARLTVPARGIDLYVLEGASGRTLAFGPGHLAGSALPGRSGNSVLSGHRDTHFAFLRDLREGDALWIEGLDGARRLYRFEGATVVDKADLSWTLPGAGDRLTLVTCYPFGAVRPGGRLRYVVTAVGV